MANLPYKNRDQVKRLRDLTKPVRRYGDHSKEISLAPVRRRTNRKGH